MSVVFGLNSGNLSRILGFNDSHLLLMCSPNLLHLQIKLFLCLHDLLNQSFLGRLHLMIKVLLLLLVATSLSFYKRLMSTQMIIHQLL